MACSRIDSSKISQRALPSSFARYMAESASRSSASGSATPTGSAADAEARGHEALAAVELHRRAQGAGQAVGDAAGGDSRRPSRDHHGELVAAEAGDHVAGAQHAAQPLGDDLEQAVAGAVAERVVDDLEVVEVDEQDRDLERLRRRRSPRCRRCRKKRAVREPGQRVVVRLVVELALDALALGDVEEVADPVGGRVVAVVDERVLPQAPADRRRRRTGSGARSRRRRPAARRRRGPPRARASSSAAPTSSSSVRPVASHRRSLMRWTTPSRPTMAIPIGASSNAERKRSSLSREASRASSFMRQETMLTMPSALMNAAWTAAQRHGCSLRGGVGEDGVGVERAQQPVVHEHVQEREQVREPLLVRREQRDHHEEVEVRLDAAVPQVDEHRRGGQQREADGGRAAVAPTSSVRPASQAKTAIGTISHGGVRRATCPRRARTAAARARAPTRSRSSHGGA